jgi:hypothetical protein
MPLTRAEAHKILLSIDGAKDGLHYRQPAIFIGEEFLTRIHHKDDAVVILTGSIEMRDVMLEAEPGLFYVIDHYKNFAALLARLSKLDRKALLGLLQPRIAEIRTAPPRRAKKKAAKKKIARAKRSHASTSSA